MFTIRLYTYKDEPLIDYYQIQSRAFLFKVVQSLGEADGFDLKKVPLHLFDVDMPKPLGERKSYLKLDVISDTYIRECPHFDKRPNVDVFVPPLYLTKYMYVTRVEVKGLKWECFPLFIKRILNRNRSSYKGLRFVLHFDVDQAIADDWKAQGFPLFMGTSEPMKPDLVKKWLIRSTGFNKDGKPSTHELDAPTLLALINRLYLHDKLDNIFNTITGIASEGATFSMLLDTLHLKLRKELGMSDIEAKGALNYLNAVINHRKQS